MSGLSRELDPLSKGFFFFLSVMGSACVLRAGVQSLLVSGSAPALTLNKLCVLHMALCLSELQLVLLWDGMEWWGWPTHGGPAELSGCGPVCDWPGLVR